jgi:hypothetical protein
VGWTQPASSGSGCRYLNGMACLRKAGVVDGLGRRIYVAERVGTVILSFLSTVVCHRAATGV